HSGARAREPGAARAARARVHAAPRGGTRRERLRPARPLGVAAALHRPRVRHLDPALARARAARAARLRRARRARVARVARRARAAAVRRVLARDHRAPAVAEADPALPRAARAAALALPDPDAGR